MACTGRQGAVAAAIARARVAQPAWGSLPPTRRLAVIAALRRLIPGALDELLPTLRHPRRRDDGESVTAEILPLIDAAAFLERQATRILRPRRLGRRGAPRWLGRPRLELRRRPFGVVLLVGPANYPLLLPGVQALQALAAGNAVLVKPGRHGSAAARTLGALLARAGLPDGCYGVLDDDPSTAIAAAAAADLVLLTGSAAAGRAIQRACAEDATPCILELSGADAVFVLPGADPDATAEAIAFALALNGGASCIAPRRCFVASELADALTRRLRNLLAEDARPAPSDGGGARTAALVARIVAAGGRVVVGGSGDGIVRPTVLRMPPAALRHLHQDLTEPVVGVVAVRDMDEALALDGSCPYALGASVFGPRLAAEALARRCRAGCVTINDLVVTTADPRLPFGGGGASGFGVTRGAEGLLALTRVQALSSARPRRRARRRLDDASARALVALLHGRLLERLRALRQLARHPRRGIEEPS